MGGTVNVRSWLPDVTPLRQSAQYRAVYVAGFFSALGGQATYIATAFQLRLLTHSELIVGSLGLVEVVPLLVFGLYGGVWADRWSRRAIVLLTEVLLALCAAALTLNAFVAHPRPWIIFVVDGLLVSAGAIQTPTLTAMTQSLVSHEHQRQVAILSGIRMTTMSLIGPALGGLLAVLAGPGWAYALNLATFVFSFTLLLRIQRTAPSGNASSSQIALVRDGLRYLRTRGDIIGTYVVDFWAMAMGYPVAMLPFVAAEFHQRWVLSVLYCAIPGGALLATLFSAWTKHVHFYGRAIVYSAGAWGRGIALFGYSSTLVFVVLGLAVAGAGDAYSGVFRQALWNESIDVDVRGRMAGVELISYAIGPPLGQFRAGSIAGLTTLRASLVSGGLACSGGLALAGRGMRRLWRFDARTNPDVAAVRARRNAPNERGDDLH